MKGIKKLPLAAAIAVLSASANAELVALDEEVMGSMTGQAGITIEATAKVQADSVAYKANGGQVSLEGLRLGGSMGTALDGSADGSLSQTMTVDVAASGSNGAAAGASGDTLIIGVGATNVSARVGAVRMGTASVGALEVDGLSLDGTTTKVYALTNDNGIGIDTNVNQKIGRVAYKDINFDSSVTNSGNAALKEGEVLNAVNTTNLGEGGTVAFNDIDISNINMTGTEVHVVSGNGADSITISQPTITNGSISVRGIQIGSADKGSVAAYDQTIGGVLVSALSSTGGGDITITPRTGSEGIDLTQKLNITADVTYVSGSIDADAAEQASDDLEAGYGNSPTAQQSARIAIADVSYYGSTEVATDPTAQAAGVVGDGVGSITAEELKVTGDLTAGISVNGSNQLIVSNGISSGTFGIKHIRLGTASLGGLDVQGLNVSSTAKIYAH